MSIIDAEEETSDLRNVEEKVSKKFCITHIGPFRPGVLIMVKGDGGGGGGIAGKIDDKRDFRKEEIEILRKKKMFGVKAEKVKLGTCEEN